MSVTTMCFSYDTITVTIGKNGLFRENVIRGIPHADDICVKMHLQSLEPYIYTEKKVK